MIDGTLVQYPQLHTDNRIERFYIGRRMLNEWRNFDWEDGAPRFL